ncbi:hypothetical protein [uncultured Methylobacterium sp.]
MNASEIFVVFGIPVIVLIGAYAAVLANERAVKRARRMAGD